MKQIYFLFVLFLVMRQNIFCAQWSHLPTEIRISVAQAIAQDIISDHCNDPKKSTEELSKSFDTIKSLTYLGLINKENVCLKSRYHQIARDKCTKSKNVVLMASCGYNPKDILTTHIETDYPDDFWQNKLTKEILLKTPKNFIKLITLKPHAFEYTLQKFNIICTQTPHAFRQKACMQFLKTIPNIGFNSVDMYFGYPEICLFFAPKYNNQTKTYVKTYAEATQQLIADNLFEVLFAVTSKGWPIFSSNDQNYPDDVSSLKNKFTGATADDKKRIKTILENAHVICYTVSNGIVHSSVRTFKTSSCSII